MRQVRGIVAGSVFGLAFTLVLLAPSFAGTVATGAAIPAAAVTLELRTAVSGFNGPVALANAGDGSGRLFVVEQDGRIRVARNGRIESTFLDITSIVDSSDFELGLLGLAFHPNYASNGRFFVYYTSTIRRTRWPSTASPRLIPIARIHRPWRSCSPSTTRTPITTAVSWRSVLTVFCTWRWGTAEAGGPAQQRPEPEGAARQGPAVGRGRRALAAAPRPTRSRPTNPFVGRSDARPEIWAYGLRNPWRLSFDRANGDLYIADVGQNQYEEINYLPGGSAGGQNYGWNRMEGAALLQQQLVQPDRADPADPRVHVTAWAVR